MTKQEKNKALVLEAFETAFNKRDQSAYERYWSPNYIQHSAHIEPGREGLQKIMSSTPANMKYEHGLILAEGDFVMVHGRYSNTGLPRPWVIVDILRIENGLLAEHWDVIQDEVTAQESKSGRPMFGEQFFVKPMGPA
jgi:predicted SnoaL-like aldol condensation-catalyzing enzyme